VNKARKQNRRKEKNVILENELRKAFLAGQEEIGFAAEQLPNPI